MKEISRFQTKTLKMSMFYVNFRTILAFIHFRLGEGSRKEGIETQKLVRRKIYIVLSKESNKHYFK